MTTLAVRFDEELSVAHRIDEGFLPCPQAVVVLQGNQWSGHRRVVMPCGGEWGHDGDCARPTGEHTATTVCGLSLIHLPFVPAPAGLVPCFACFNDVEPADVVEEGLFV